MAAANGGWVRWLRPSLTIWLWVTLVVVLSTEPWRVAMISADGDPCMHWACGEWMLTHWRLLDRDVFSQTHLGQPIVSKEWLAQLLMAVAGRWDGLAGIALLAAVVLATTFAALHAQLVRDRNDLMVATAVTVLAMWASVTHWIARPHLLTMLLMVGWNGQLRRAPSWRWYVGLPLLMLGWVNLHGGFLAGFITLGCYGLGAVLERDGRRVRALMVVAVLCAGVSMLNPSGYRLHVHNLAFVRNPFFTDWLAEYASADFHNPAHAGFLLLLLAVWGALALAPQRWRPTDVVLTVVWGYFALYSVRNIPLLAIVVAPTLASIWSALIPAGWRERTRRWSWLEDTRAGWALAVGVMGWLVFGFDRPTTMPSDKFPVEAVAYVRARPDEFRGRMFNQYIWGGYLLVALPEHPVFIDGRADFYGEAHVRAFDRITDLQPGWQDELRRFDITWTLMPPDHRLNAALALAGWQKIYADATAVIYRR